MNISIMYDHLDIPSLKPPSRVRVLAVNAYKAVKAVYRPLGKVSKSLPILAHILICEHEGRLAMSTHDLNEPLTEYVSCMWKGNTWSTCIPMRPFKDYLSIMAHYKDLLTLVFDEQALTVTVTCDSDKSRSVFKCMSAADFPPVDIQ